VPQLDALGIDLLSQMLQYHPPRRITARAALSYYYICFFL
jgi:hypothetical protein